MMFSVAAAISLFYVLLFALCVTGAWKNWFGWGWKWIAGFVVTVAMVPFIPIKQTASDEAAYVIEQDRAYADGRTRELPPKVEVDTGRDFQQAKEQLEELVTEQASDNEAQQTPKGD